MPPTLKAYLYHIFPFSFPVFLRSFSAKPRSLL